MFDKNKTKVIELMYWLIGGGAFAILATAIDSSRGWIPYAVIVIFFVWGLLGRYFALLELQAAKREMAKKAMIDESTGVLSRARVIDALSHEVKSAKRKQDKLTIILIEAVNIMEINQKFDRFEGDACLAAVAMASQACLRETDYLGRSGGLIFCAILPGADEDATKVVRERMITKIADIARSHPKGEVHVKCRSTLCQWDDSESHLGLISRAELLLQSGEIFESSGHASE